MKKLKEKLQKTETKKGNLELKYEQKLQKIDTSKFDVKEEIEYEEQIRVEVGLTGIEIKISKIENDMIDELFEKIENSKKVKNTLGIDNIETLKEGRNHFKHRNELLSIAKKLA